MNVYDFDKEFNVYFSAQDRITKKVSDHIYEVFHITVVKNDSMLVVKTIDLNELNEEDINKHLSDCGLQLTKDHKIVQKYTPDEVIESNPERFEYTLADRLSISGVAHNTTKYPFEDAKDLNEILIEHDIPYKFDNIDLISL